MPLLKPFLFQLELRIEPYLNYINDGVEDNNERCEEHHQTKHHRVITIESTGDKILAQTGNRNGFNNGIESI